ncbi:hypothetical protein NA56DRAFT_706516 [Hyaloscypha hepaticicola]|uniref:Uncharacterized protein n=1 Tax=Hyaloscypha hepaticicola TaxID=2082293 RepID=A0A2J6PXA9_9HELO|nr:hypothetical protein NA56DRAFT_706516 [Hyaloscypha hepaticicola]
MSRRQGRNPNLVTQAIYRFTALAAFLPVSLAVPGIGGLNVGVQELALKTQIPLQYQPSSRIIFSAANKLRGRCRRLYPGALTRGGARAAGPAVTTRGGEGEKEALGGREGGSGR